MMHKWLLRLAYAGLVLAPIAAGANYFATQPGSGTTFASALISGAQYVQFLLTDSGGGDVSDTANHAIKVNVVAGGAGGGVVTQPTGTNLHAVLDTTSTTAVTQATGTNLHSVVDSGTITTVSTVSAARVVGNGGGVLDANGQNVAAPANWLQFGCQFQTVPTTITATNGSPCQVDNAGNLLVNVKNANANVGNNVDAVATSGTAGSPVINYAYGFNGSTWDRQLSINNQIRVQVAQTVQAAAYASGNAVGGLMTIANAARVSGSLGASGTGGILQNVAVNSKSVQTAQMDIFVFDANPSGSTCTDKTAFVLATADFDKVIGVISVPGSVTNNNGWFSGGTGSVGQAENQAMAYDISSGTSLFACMVTRGTPTFAATTDISLKYQFLRN